MAAQLGGLFADVYTRSPEAAAFAAEAARLGLGEARLASASPQTVYLVQGGGPNVEALELYGAALFSAGVQVVPLNTLPAARRDATWGAATRILDVPPVRRPIRAPERVPADPGHDVPEPM